MPRRIIAAAIAALLAATLSPAAAVPPPGSVPQDRSVEPVVLTGSLFPGWSAGPDPTFREPQIADDPFNVQSDCYNPGQNPYDASDTGDGNCYQDSRIPRNPNEGVPVERLLGYRWDPGAGAFVQIPFQVDERFTRYLSNNRSGFAFYSAVDQHTSYAFDREGFRYTSDASQYEIGGDVCEARPAAGSTVVDGYATTPDPIRGLDDLDELVFMWSDAGPQAAAGTPLPEGITGAFEVAVADPTDPATVVFAYVMLAGEGGPAPAYDATNGYVRYERDPDADMFVYSQSSYSGYGAAPRGPHCDPVTAEPVRDAGGNLVIAQRRPKDTAWVRTPRYAFRYDGRWLMTDIRISDDDTGLTAGGLAGYGPDIVDRWKARAFQQRPGGRTPCCGFEEEETNWGGSSILMGERWGPVRAIRETWGADSATNNVRREVFYRDLLEWGNHLRVHPIPPLDGIYVQWDWRAARVDRYYNSRLPEGVPVDGQNDEVFGNFFVQLAQDGVAVRTEDDMPLVGPQDEEVPLPLGPHDRCRVTVGPQRVDSFCNDIDLPDPTFSDVQALQWEQITGPYGTVVTRWRLGEITLGGGVQSLFAVPYYRDDSCFGDGTGTDPGPHLNHRNVDDIPPYNTYWDPVDELEKPRECWRPEHGDPTNPITNPAGPQRFWQGAIGTHGLHLLLVAESDNAGLTVPLTEIHAEQRLVFLPGGVGNVGERYGRAFVEHPLRPAVRPLSP